MRHSKLSLRLIASLALFGLIASLLHAHTESHTDSEQNLERGSSHDFVSATGTPSPSVSRDDAHHEHSSRHAIDLEVCLACRSHHEDEQLAASGVAQIIFTIATTSECTRQDPCISHLQTNTTGPRAPPASIG